jgi:hypothetical protein
VQAGGDPTDGISALLGHRKTETRPQPQRRDHQRTCTMRDCIVTCGKLLDERGKLKPPGLPAFEQVKPAA